MYWSVRSATHHIFFPPRPEVVVEEQNPDGFSSYVRHQFPLDGFFGHQTHRPAGVTLRRIAAYHGNNALFLVHVQHFGRAGARLLIESAIQAGLLVAMAEPTNGLWSERNHLGNLGGTGFLG